MESEAAHTHQDQVFGHLSPLTPAGRQQHLVHSSHAMASPAHTCGQEEEGVKQLREIRVREASLLSSPHPEPHSCREYSSLSSDLEVSRVSILRPGGCGACRQEAVPS